MNHQEIQSHGQTINKNISFKLLSISEYLSTRKLAIPEYQRPYKWSVEDVRQTILDIKYFSNRSSYRLGTIVLHDDEKHGTLNIVDGQQRTITLILIIHALAKHRISTKNENLQVNLAKIINNFSEFSFSNIITKRNIINNYAEIVRITGQPDFTKDIINFLLNKCQIVLFTLNNISEAFQFFDSQNARGKDLAPHDLLKAYHLREMSEDDSSLKARAVRDWEDCDQGELIDLFAEHLYRIRNWSRGNSARYFSKKDIGLFKGINLNAVSYPYQQQLRLAQAFVEQHNRDYGPRTGLHQLTFPFQLDQTIINGRNFFEMVAHYHRALLNLSSRQEKKSLDKIESWLKISSNRHPTAHKILNTLNTYEGSSRIGDQYVRNLFDCLLLYYIDKFGETKIERAIINIFIWSYSLRLKNYSIQLASIDNYVLVNNPFLILRNAASPEEFLTLELAKVDTTKSTKTLEIQNLFKELNYL